MTEKFIVKIISMKKELFIKGKMQMNKNVAFLGAGSMAEAIISGIVRADIIPKEQILVTNRSRLERLEQLHNQYGVTAMEDKEILVKEADIIYLAAKPYDMQDLINSIKGYLHQGQLLISVAAGVQAKDIEDWTGLDIPVIRAMPNTSAQVGYSATAISSGNYAGNEHVKQAEALFNTIGTTTVVEETDMHTVTAIAGSGPAFIYYMVEAMQKAAEEFGLDREVSHQLLTQTVLGAGYMLKESGESPEALREKITSPNGTTEAGIKTLDEHYYQKIIMECIKNAQQRSVELGK